MIVCGAGNFGELPNPPYSWSNRRSRSSNAEVSTCSSSVWVVSDGDAVISAFLICSAELTMSLLCSLHRSEIFGIKSSIPVIPNRPSRGIYVAAKNGFLSGVMTMLSGQPPLPVIIWQTIMYTLSMSGRSSRSTLMHTKASLRSLATTSSSNDSCNITWHQWHVAYPIERETGLSSRIARWNASSPHGYQSTGL